MGIIRSASALLGSFFFFLSLSACVPRAEVPIPVLEYGTMDASVHKNLLILMRGLGGSNRDFEKHGLIEEIRRRDLPFDIVAPDGHYGYYKTESIQERLKYDIIEPARQKGYQHIWLAGFSMGGLGSLFYLKFYPDDVDGVILVSPFVGWAEIQDEIAGAGGVSQWDPQESSVDDWQRLIWEWIRSYSENSGLYPPIFLGYGENDFLAKDGPRLLSDVLPPDHVLSVPGNHDYGTFKKIWQLTLSRAETELSKLPRERNHSETVATSESPSRE